MRVRRPKSRIATLTTAALIFLAIAGFLLTAYKTASRALQQEFTFYPPSVYMNAFLACMADSTCVRTENFEVHSVPTGCCVLLLTNGNGSGNDEVRNYEVSLNGTSVIPAGHSRSARASVKILKSNTLKVTLTGEPNSKVFILIAYDPQISK
jgi:hypothetical protein